MAQDSLTAGLYARQQKGLVIAQTKKVRQTRNDLWLVPSQSHPGTYLVDMVEQTCTCPDHEATRGLCKVNEVLAKVLCFNLTVLVHEMFELGITPEFLPVAV